MKKKYYKTSVGILVRVINKRVFFRFYSNSMPDVKRSMDILGYNETEYQTESFMYDWHEREYNKNKKKIVNTCKYQLSMLEELHG
jgi:hypothetical protein